MRIANKSETHLVPAYVKEMLLTICVEQFLLQPLRAVCRGFHSAASRRGKCFALSFLFFVYPFHFEDDWTCAVGAAAYHFVLTSHPAFHDRAILQTCIDIAADGIPSLRAMRYLRTTGNGIRICRSLNQRIETSVPEMVVHLVATRNTLIFRKCCKVATVARVKNFMYARERITVNFLKY